MTEESYQPIDRRPVSSRNMAAIKRIASFLAQRNVSANMISVFGALSAAGAGLCFAGTRYSTLNEGLLWIVGVLLVQGRLLANVLDGMVAIAQGKASALGELYNEVPDRISDTFIFVGLGYSVGGSVEFGYIAALTAMFTAYVRAVGKVAGAGQHFSGPMAKQHRMFVVTLAGLLCSLLPVPTLCFAGMCQFAIPAGALVVCSIGSILTAMVRLMKIKKDLVT